MTAEEIIDTDHKVGTLFITQFGVASVTVEWLKNFAALVAAAEREARAKVCDDIEEAYQRQESMRHPALRTDAETGSGECAAAIRARGNT